ncbi:hypothetical protein K438DRAFT_1284248 [Mycena galopus ATCC 62051]|nr:hypothetical protein K438DRAFT_1284248 [Mycena galopus ATCC 62051]
MRRNARQYESETRKYEPSAYVLSNTSGAIFWIVAMIIARTPIRFSGAPASRGRVSCCLTFSTTSGAPLRPPLSCPDLDPQVIAFKPGLDGGRRQVGKYIRVSRLELFHNCGRRESSRSFRLPPCLQNHGEKNWCLPIFINALARLMDFLATTLVSSVFFLVSLLNLPCRTRHFNNVVGIWFVVKLDLHDLQGMSWNLRWSPCIDFRKILALPLFALSLLRGFPLFISGDNLIPSCLKFLFRPFLRPQLCRFFLFRLTYTPLLLSLFAEKFEQPGMLARRNPTHRFQAPCRCCCHLLLFSIGTFLYWACWWGSNSSIPERSLYAPPHWRNREDRRRRRGSADGVWGSCSSSPSDSTSSPMRSKRNVKLNPTSAACIKV